MGAHKQPVWGTPIITGRWVHLWLHGSCTRQFLENKSVKILHIYAMKAKMRLSMKQGKSHVIKETKMCIETISSCMF